MKTRGWIRWIPGQKYHLMIPHRGGVWTLCHRWGVYSDYHDMLVKNPPERKKCKDCLRKLEESRT